MKPLLTIIALCLSALAHAAEDWPTYRHDLARSGVTSERLEAARLVPEWTHESAAAPLPAWPGPAKWDAYAGLRGLRSMRNYDAVLHPIVVGDAVFFSSNVDDSVHCLDLTTGEERWAFTADAPVRVAPTYASGRLYFGADDGYAYCIDGADGALVWRFSPTAATAERTVLNNGRLVSFWPVRTGVIVVNDTAYFGASFVPWKDSYLCAVDAETGLPEGDGRYVRTLGLERTLEGALLAGGMSLIVPQGRVAPMLFNRADGAPEGMLPGGGGSFVLLTDDNQVFHGPGNKGGWIIDSDAASRAQVASYDRGTGLVVSGDTSFLLRADALGAINRKTQQPLWAVETSHSHAIILAGATVFLGGDDSVEARDAATGDLLWRGEVYGRAHGLAVANGRLLVATDEGRLTAFIEGDRAAPVAAPAIATVEHAPSPMISPLRDPALRDRWVFQRNALEGEGVVSRVSNLARGLPATIVGVPRFERVGDLEAMALDGVQSGFSIAEDFHDAALPTRDLTVAAWVRIDEPIEWGGIAGAQQDNGSYERGWLLGYRNSLPSFALVGADGGDGFTRITAPEAFTAGGWHHFAATYDGRVMRLFVDGVQAAESAAETGDILYPEAGRYHVGAYLDDNEHYRMQGMLHEVLVYARALDADEIARLHGEKASAFPEPVAPVLAEDTDHPLVGPYLAFTSPESAVVRWTTGRPTPTRLDLARGSGLETLGDPRPKTDHEVTIRGLRRERVYTYRIHHTEGPGLSPEYECDTSFNYTQPAITLTREPIDPRVALATDRLGEERGIAVVLGVPDRALLDSLVTHTRFGVIVFETDPDRIAAARGALRRAGVYGHRVAVQPCESLAHLKTPDAFADAVFCDPERQSGPGVYEEIGRIMQPAGGAAIVRRLTTSPPAVALAMQSGDRHGCRVECVPAEQMLVATKGEIPNSGVWTHMYGTPDNAAYAGESLAGADSTEQLELNWLGRPGPRYQSDRGNRKPSPLAADGRLYMQGLNRIIAMDSYNGTILWALETPTVQRFNVPRDSSNWCADADRVYVAARDRVWAIDGRTGRVETNHPVVSPAGVVWASDWGFLASDEDRLIGSAVKEGSAFTDWWGPENWYDGKDGHPARKISSDNLYAVNKDTGSKLWEYQNGVVINPTITLAGGRVFFVENRNEQVKSASVRRLDGDTFWQDQHLVAIDAATGEPAWDSPIEVLPGISAFYLASADNTLVIVSSQGGRFGTYAYDASDGSLLWSREMPWEVDHHGKHLSRPAIVKGRVIIRPYVLDLASGRDLPLTFPGGHQCGTYTCSDSAIFLRAGNLSVWSQQTNERTEFNRLRPDCWISTIPANGMLLSPEGGGGCSCGSWMEVSMGLLPRGN